MIDYRFLLKYFPFVFLAALTVAIAVMIVTFSGPEKEIRDAWNRRDTATLIVLGSRFKTQKRYDLALNACEKALEIEPGNTEALVCRFTAQYAKDTQTNPEETPR